MTPTTSAGRALLAAPWMLAAGQPLMVDRILAIEAQARAAERARLRVAVVALPMHLRRNGRATPTRWVNRAAVLAQLEETP